MVVHEIVVSNCLLMGFLVPGSWFSDNQAGLITETEISEKRGNPKLIYEWIGEGRQEMKEDRK
jgi:hypothetical protein